MCDLMGFATLFNGEFIFDSLVVSFNIFPVMACANTVSR